MTARLYVRRGGDGSVDTEYTQLNPSLRKGAPIFDRERPLIQLGMRFEQGEASQGTFLVSDPAAEIPTATMRLPPHALVTLTEDASGDELWLARGRIAPLENGRRASKVPKAEVEWDATVNDCNMDLRGLPFSEDWVRPAETGVARLNALEDYILNGAASTSPNYRETTDITVQAPAGGHLCPNTATVTMPAKTYPAGTQPVEVLDDCCSAEGKIGGVVIHHTGGSSHLCLLYIADTDHTTYSTAVKISDHIADNNPDDPTAPVFYPVWDMGKGTVWDHDFVATAVVSRWSGTNNNPQTVYVERPSLVADYEYWGETLEDSDSQSAAEAEQRANSYLDEHKVSTATHRVSILVSASQTKLLCAGMSLQVKSAVVAGGPDLNTYVTRRIAELKWEPNPDGRWWAHMQLGRGLRRSVSRGKVQPQSTTPKPPDDGEPGTPPVAPTTDYYWTFFDRGGADIANLYDDGTDTILWHQAGWNVGGTAWWGGSGMVTDSMPVTAGETYTFTADLMQNSTIANAYLRVEWYDGSNNQLQIDYIGGPGLSLNAFAAYSKIIAAPATATHIKMRGYCFRGKKGTADNIYVKHGGSSGTPGTPSTSPVTTVGGTGEGEYTDSQEYVPVGSVLEHLYITEGGPYHDADQIAIDDAGNYFASTEVEGALQELALGIRSYHDYGALGATEVFDIRDGNALAGTLTTDCDITFTGLTAGVATVWRVHIYGDGASNVTFPDVLWPDSTAPTIDVTADSHWFEFISVDGGATVYGDYGGQTATFSLTVKDEGTPLATDATSLDFVGSGVVASGAGAAKTITISGAPTGAAGGDLSGTYPNPSVVDDSHSHTSATAPGSAGSSETHVHIVDEQFSGDASVTVFDLANEAVPETAIAYVAGTRTSVTVSGTMNDQITFGSPPASGTNNISVDYVAVAT